MKRILAAAAIACGWFSAAVAQTPPVRGGVASFPAQQREPDDPALVARGNDLYTLNCRSCHGPDLRGGEMGGPNLLRRQLVLRDQNGELLGPVIHGDRKDQGMPAIDMSNDDVKAVAAFIHSVLAKSPGQGAPPPGETVELNILVGDPQAGRMFFDENCSACHSITGDLERIGARDLPAMQLQNLWLSGGRGARGRGGPTAGPPPPPMSTRGETTVTVTLPAGGTVKGRLERIDDFLVSLTQADGTPRSFRRRGAVPKVEVHDPLAAHRNLLPVYTDKNIHDVTAFLAGVK